MIEVGSLKLKVPSATLSHIEKAEKTMSDDEDFQLPAHICPACGYYDGREVLEAKDAA